MALFIVHPPFMPKPLNSIFMTTPMLGHAKKTAFERWLSPLVTGLIVGSLGLSVLIVQAETSHPPSPEGLNGTSSLMIYQGADRESRLLREAKKEGNLTLYTSQSPKDTSALVEVFQKKYDIKVTVWRASGEKVVQRAVTEAHAHRYTPDVYESDVIVLESLYREKLLQEFSSPSFKDLPPSAFQKGHFYVADRFNFYTLVFNTNLVKPEEAPKSYSDLLNPKWSGKLGLEVADSDWFAAMVKSMGESEGLSYFRRLKDNKPQLRKGHTLMAELVAAGEIPIAVALYNHAAERLIKSGAPIEWRALPPTLGRAGALGVAINLSHPNSALLFVDFVLSKEGQEIIKSRQRVPASSAVQSPLSNFPYKLIDPSITLDENKKWDKIWNDLFVNQYSVDK
jgi:iron(III) transport system substrate-binding protein